MNSSQKITQSIPEQPLGSEVHPEIEQNPVAQEVPILLEHALIRNLAILQQHNLASAEDCSQVAAIVRGNWEKGKGSDPIDVLARLRSGDGNMLDTSVEMIAAKVASSLSFIPTRVPFAGRLIPPTSFYEKYPQITQLARLMKVPVSYTEDLDVIGIASVNPFFANTLAEAISGELRATSPVKPIMSAVRLDYIGWVKMCEKHFK